MRNCDGVPRTNLELLTELSTHWQIGRRETLTTFLFPRPNTVYTHWQSSTHTERRRWVTDQLPKAQDSPARTPARDGGARVTDLVAEEADVAEVGAVHADVARVLQVVLRRRYHLGLQPALGRVGRLRLWQVARGEGEPVKIN